MRGAQCEAIGPKASAATRVLSKQPNQCHALTSTLFTSRVRAPRTCARAAVFDHEDSVPNIASAKKNMRKSRAAQVRNRAQRSALRTALKKASAAGASAEVKLQAVKLLDRAARKGLIHRNAAGRQKSRLAKAT